jgi:hypothetical protein
MVGIIVVIMTIPRTMVSGKAVSNQGIESEI